MKLPGTSSWKRAARSVITTPAGDAGAIVRDGRTGFVVGFGDTQQLAERIVSLAGSTELRQRMGEAGRSELERCYTRDGLAESLLSVYAAIAARSGHPQLRTVLPHLGRHHIRGCPLHESFPGRVNTFFARDVRALLDAGIDVDIFPLYPLKRRYWAAVPAFLMLSPCHAGACITSVSRAPSDRVAARIRTTSGPCCAPDGGVALRAAPLARPRIGAKGWAGRTCPAGYDTSWRIGQLRATAAYVFHASPHAMCRLIVPHAERISTSADILEEKLAYADNIFVGANTTGAHRELYPARFSELDRKITLHHLPLDLAEFAFDRGRRDSTTSSRSAAWNRRKASRR